MPFLNRFLVNRAVWWAALIFSLVFPFLLVNFVESLGLAEGNWFSSLPFARVAMVSGLPLLWWLLLMPTHSRTGRLVFGSIASLIYTAFALTVFAIPCGC